MANCRVCSATVLWAMDEEGNRIPLDAHEQLDYGPERYRIIRDGVMPIVARIPDASAARVYVDHRHLCRQPRAL